METDKYNSLSAIPVVGIGTQPAEDGDEHFSFMSSPGAMHTYNQPIIPEPEETEQLTAAKSVLAELATALQHYQVGTVAQAFDISNLDAANLDLTNQILNEGEVSVIYTSAPDDEEGIHVQIQESVLTGVWRVRYTDEQGNRVRDTIEIADIPSLVREQRPQNNQPDTNFSDLPEGVFNAPSLLTELAEKTGHWQPGDIPHVVNLTLLPLSPEDLLFLGERLGVGTVTILSRGYGNCRIGSTAIGNIWWVKYYNSEDALILNTIEVSEVPEVACAAREDIEESAERLQEILAIYQ